MKIVVDGKGSVAGRIGSYAAKNLLKGNSVEIINCEGALISGDKKGIIEKFNRLRKMGRGGSLKGPRISKLPDRLLKRMIRGMLPWDKAKGRVVFKKLKCYVGSGNLKEDELKNVKKLEHKKPYKYMTIKQVSEIL